MHVYLEFKHTKDLSSRKKLHVVLIDPNNGLEYVREGQYTVARNKYSIQNYMLKDLQESDVPFTNLELLLFEGKMHDSPEEYLGAIARFKGVDEAMKILMDRFPVLAATRAVTFRRNFRVLREEHKKQISSIENSIRSTTPAIDSFSLPDSFKNAVNKW